jgi:hypothetical protein
MIPKLGAAGATLLMLAVTQVVSGLPAFAESADELAQKLSNPVSSLISVPFQYNYDSGFGDGDGVRSFINIQPVIPFSIGEDWNLISRTILPVVNQSDFSDDYDTLTGAGNITQSFFFSPKAPTSGGTIWGVGPVLQLPTATDGIAPKQWGAGITGVALKQSNGWTVGALVNHVWSIGESDKYGDSSLTFLQPFLSYTTAQATTFGVNTESAYDWEREQWTVPVNFTMSQIIKIGGKPVSVTGGARYWVESPEGGPDGWGARVAVTYLFPK